MSDESGRSTETMLLPEYARYFNSRLYLLVAVHGRWRERGQANGEVFGAFGRRRGVTNPLALAGDDRLPGGNVNDAAFVFDAESAFDYDSKLIEIGTLF